MCVFNLKIHKDSNKLMSLAKRRILEFCWSARGKLLEAISHRGLYFRKQFLYLYINCLSYNTKKSTWLTYIHCKHPASGVRHLGPPPSVSWSMWSSGVSQTDFQGDSMVCKRCCHHNTNIPNTSGNSAILHKTQPCFSNAKCCMSFALFQNSYIINHCSKLVARIKYISFCSLKLICWKCAIVYVG